MKARLALLALLCAACAPHKPDTRQKGLEPARPVASHPVAPPREAVVVAPPDPRIQLVGHSDTRQPAAPRFAWPATEVQLGFEGTSLHVELTDTPHPDEQPDTDWLSIEIDDLEPRKLALREGRHSYELAEDLAPGRHTLRLRKRTEPEVGTVTLHGFRLPPDGKVLEPRSRAEHRIEVIGDSISAGYGNEGPNEHCQFSAETEDATRTYATLAARELDRHAAVLAWSGKGLTRNFERGEPETMSDLFERVLPGEADSPRLRDPVPHAFVVNLGTNDFFRGIPGRKAFVRSYDALLERLFARAPEAKLVLVLPPLLADDHPHRNARSTLRAYLTAVLERQRRNGRTAVLVEQHLEPAEGVGCDHHPSLASHARLGHELAEALRPLLEPQPQ